MSEQINSKEYDKSECYWPRADGKIQGSVPIIPAASHYCSNQAFTHAELSSEAIMHRRQGLLVHGVAWAEVSVIFALLLFSALLSI
jgi:hypothetical protein